MQCLKPKRLEDLGSIYNITGDNELQIPPSRMLERIFVTVFADCGFPLYY